MELGWIGTIFAKESSYLANDIFGDGLREWTSLAL
jgi:hypothetical protein